MKDLFQKQQSVITSVLKESSDLRYYVTQYRVNSENYVYKIEMLHHYNKHNKNSFYVASVYELWMHIREAHPDRYGAIRS